MKHLICLRRLTFSALTIWFATAVSPQALAEKADIQSVEELQSALNLSEEQAEELQALRQAFEEEVADLHEELASAEDRSTRRELAREYRSMAGKYQQELGALLDPEQMSQLQELLKERRASMQQSGPHGSLAEYLEKLDLTPEQKVEFESVMMVYQPEMRALMGDLQDAKGFRQKRKIGGELKDLRGELDADMKAFLSDEQYATWQTIQEERREAMREQM